MQTWTRFRASSWWQKLKHSPRSLLMLDYDGTLAPFARERMKAIPYPGVRERLVKLAQLPNVRVVMISGRALQELKELVPPELHSADLWGSHGREHRFPDGRYEQAPLTSEQSALLDRLEERLRAQGYSAILERKAGSMAVHTREIPEADELEVRKLIQQTLPESLSGPDSVEPMDFEGGIELRATGCSKADAVDATLSQEEPDIPAAYLGDDRTDEDAFQSLQGRGLPVLVRHQPRDSAAELWISPPDELLAFFDQWLAAAEAAKEFCS